MEYGSINLNFFSINLLLWYMAISVVVIVQCSAEANELEALKCVL